MAESLKSPTQLTIESWIQKQLRLIKLDYDEELERNQWVNFLIITIKFIFLIYIVLFLLENCDPNIR